MLSEFYVRLFLFPFHSCLFICSIIRYMDYSSIVTIQNRHYTLTSVVAFLVSFKNMEKLQKKIFIFCITAMTKDKMPKKQTPSRVPLRLTYLLYTYTRRMHTNYEYIYTHVCVYTNFIKRPARECMSRC